MLNTTHSTVTSCVNRPPSLGAVSVENPPVSHLTSQGETEGRKVIHRHSESGKSEELVRTAIEMRKYIHWSLAADLEVLIFHASEWVKFATKYGIR